MTRTLTRREMLKLVAGVGAVSLLAACGAPAATEEPEEEAPVEEEPEEEPEEAPAPAEAVDVVLWSMQYPPHDGAWDMLSKQWNEFQERSVITVEPQADWLTKYAAGLAAGEAGDLLSVHGGGAPSYIAAGHLMPVTEALGGWSTVKDRFFPAVMDYYAYDGEVYGIALHNNTPGIGFITNLDVWEDAGMTPPDRYDTWEDVWNDAKDLTQRDEDGNVTLAGLSMRNWHNIQYFCGAIYEQGGEYVDFATGEWNIQTDEAKRALTELFWDPIYTHETDLPDLPAVFNGLAEGRMASGGIWIDYIPYAAGAFPDGRFGFTMRPGMDGVEPIVVGEGGWGLNVNANAKNPDEAMEFIAYLNEDEVMLQWLKSQHSLPCVYSLLDDPWFEGDEAKFLLPALKTLENWTWIGPVGDKYAFDDIFYPALEALSLGDLNVDEALAQVEADATAKVQTFRDETGYEPSRAGGLGL